jgi:hypothetical protein
MGGDGRVCPERLDALEHPQSEWLRYAPLEQRFWADQNTGVATGLTDVATDIDFRR